MRKRTAFVGFLWTCIVLTGCQPTTDAAIVTPKSGLAGAKMMDESMAGSLEEQVQAPKNCKMELEGTNGLVKVSVDADVIVPKADGVRLKKVETRVFRQKDWENLDENLLEGQPLWQRVYTEEQEVLGYTFTKEEAYEQIEYLKGQLRQMEEAGVWNDWEREGIEKEMAWWDEYAQSTSESFQTEEIVPKVPYDKGVAEQYAQEGDEEDGKKNMLWGGVNLQNQTYNFILNNNWSQDIKTVSAWLVKGKYEDNLWELYESDESVYGYTQLDSEASAGVSEQAAVKGETAKKCDSVMDAGQTVQLQMEDSASEAKVKASLESLKKKGDALVEALGFTDMQLAGCKDVCKWYLGRMKAYAKNLIYMRTIDGIPITYTDSRWKYDLELQDYSERLQIAYDDEGLAQVIWENPSKVYDMSDEYVFLLPFSDILKTFQKEIIHTLTSQESDADIFPEKAYEIGEIRLGYMWMPDTSTEMEGMLIPVWDFMGTYSLNWDGNLEEGTEDSVSYEMSPYQSFLTVNAMDGTVVAGPPSREY